MLKCCTLTILVFVILPSQIFVRKDGNVTPEIIECFLASHIRPYGRICDAILGTSPPFIESKKFVFIISSK